ncbi:MAG: hypothetical protein DHS20C16_24950 [Phycisphaerae bacterium]|nr:MAG: hypothetical protein DHS20C16_24950 [Phycisphaerae bacterium]
MKFDLKLHLGATGLQLFVASWAGLLISAGSASGEVVSAERKKALASEITNEFRLRDFSIQRISVPEGENRSGSVTIRLGDENQEMILVPHRVFSPDYTLLIDHGDGRLEEVDMGEVATFRGTLANVPGSVVAGGWAGDGLVARIILPDDQTYWIEPLQDRIVDATALEHIVYRSEDSLPHDGTCGTLDEEVAVFEERSSENGARGSGCGGGICVTDLACDADFEYFNDYGSVTNVQNRIGTVINAMNAQYESQVGITHQIVTIIVRTSQVYTSNDASTLLNQFGSRWQNNHTNISRDIAHLFTGKNLIAPTIGIARLSAICMPPDGGFGYGLVESDFNGNFSCATDLSAHELGHNWSAPHCSCPGNTMNPSITCANSFNASLTIPGIISYRDSRGCLSPFESGVTTLPFVDDFPSTTLDASKWTGIDGAESNTEGSGEPSASNSLNIDGNDQIRSAIIDTSVPLGLDVSYFWQRTGTGNSPEAGEDFFVEYLNNAQLWIELASYPGDGPDGDPYASESFELPTDALHDSFRLRFRGTSPNPGFDDWFIDDINIDGCYGATVSPQPQPAGGCPASNLQFTTIGSGGAPISYQWFKDDVMLNDGGGISGTTTDTLSISAISDPADEGDYHCEITNECGTLESNTVPLTVFDPVELTSQPPALVTGCTGEAELIIIEAVGDGLTYEWRRDGVLLTDGGNISGATTNILTISNIGPTDVAATPGYVCTVFDNCGNFIESTATELEIAGAEVTDQPVDDCVNDGESASFSSMFNVQGGFDTFLQWHKDGSPIVDGGNISGAFTNALTINPATVADEGGYSLRILVLGPNCALFSGEGQLTIDDCGCTLNSECEDGNPCTDDICDGVLGCINPNNTDLCDDGDACTTVDACSGGACVGSIPLDCDDTNPCTDDSCDSGTGCVNTDNADPCDDGDACTTVDVCDTGACVGSIPLDCDDTNPCTDDSCDSGTGCVNTDNTDPCDDGDACTTVDVCDTGACIGSIPLDCDDTNPCTDDSCDSGTGCVNTDNFDPCDDGDACTTVDQCDTGSCVGSTPLACDDGDFCNGIESCDSGSGCLPGLDPCDGSSWCDESGDACVPFGDGDINSDGSVDLLDFAGFQSCFGLLASGGCEALNLTGDGIVDIGDFEALEALLTGP